MAHSKYEDLKRLAEDIALEDDFNRAYQSVIAEDELKRLSEQVKIREIEDKLNNLVFSSSKSEDIEDLSRMLGSLDLKERSYKDPLKIKIQELKEKIAKLQGKTKQKMPVSRRIPLGASSELSRHSKVLSDKEKKEIEKRFLLEISHKLRKSKRRSRKSKRVLRKSKRRSRKSKRKSKTVLRKSRKSKRRSRRSRK